MLLFNSKAALLEPTLSKNSWKSLCPRHKKSGKSKLATKYPAVTGDIYAKLALG